MEALPLGSVRLRKHNGRKVAFVKVTHLGTRWKRWKLLTRVTAAKHFGPLPDGMVVRQKDGNPLNVSPENLMVVPINAAMMASLSADPDLEARRRLNQARATARLVKKRNSLKARIDRSIHIRRGQYYPVSHATQTVIFVPCLTKRQAQRFGELDAYRHLEIVPVRGAQVEDDYRGYRREIPDEGQAWKWGKRRASPGT
jgi:hypothetical protein